MWETIGSVLNGNNAIPVIIFALMTFIVIGILGKKGIISINRGGVRIGSDETERTIIRNQTQWTHLYVMSIKGKVLGEDASEAQINKTEVILEKAFDKIIDWILYNHISANNSYIEIKQGEIKSFVYSVNNLDEQYKTPEFAVRMDEWVRELILNLIQIRKEYSESK